MKTDKVDAAQPYKVLIGDCLAWLSRNRQNKKYECLEILAQDFGINGTERFFPLTELVFEMTESGKFENYLI